MAWSLEKEADVEIRIMRLEHRVQMLEERVRSQQGEVIAWIISAVVFLMMLLASVAERIPDMPR